MARYSTFFEVSADFSVHLLKAGPSLEFDVMTPPELIRALKLN